MSQVSIRGREFPERIQEVQRSQGWSIVQGAGVAAGCAMHQASGEGQEVRSGRCLGPLEGLQLLP